MAERVVIIDTTGTSEESENTVVIPVGERFRFKKRIASLGE